VAAGQSRRTPLTALPTAVGSFPIPTLATDE